jgi:hypothetical protein
MARGRPGGFRRRRRVLGIWRGAYFAYLRKLRRDIEALERSRRYSMNRRAT